MNIFEWDEQTPVTANNMNEMQNILNDNISEEVLDVYSTTEKVIGTWVDGKPLYRKVFKFGAMPNTANKDIPHNISNLGITVNCYGMAVRTSDSRALTIPDSASSGEITCSVTNTNVSVTTHSDRSSFNDSHIIIEYTKVVKNEQRLVGLTKKIFFYVL